MQKAQAGARSDKAARRSPIRRPDRKIYSMKPVALARAFVAALVSLTVSAPALANRESEALRAKASAQIFNLDRDLAVDTFRQAIAADPEDAAAYRGLATSLWLSI